MKMMFTNVLQCHSSSVKILFDSDECRLSKQSKDYMDTEDALYFLYCNEIQKNLISVIN